MHFCLCESKKGGHDKKHATEKTCNGGTTDDDHHHDITCFGLKEEKKSSRGDLRTGTVCTTCCTGQTRHAKYS